MKAMHLIEAAMMLGALVAAPAWAQTSRPTPGASTTVASPSTSIPEARIALINSDVFADEKTGITRYVTAFKGVNREFESRQAELNNMQARVKAISDEISKLNSAAAPNQQTIQAKYDEGERLQLELKRKTEDAKADYEKRFQAVLMPISQDVAKAIQRYAAQRGFTLVLDVSRISEAILSFNPATDITQAFIADYNSKNPVPANPSP